MKAFFTLLKLLHIIICSVFKSICRKSDMYLSPKNNCRIWNVRQILHTKVIGNMNLLKDPASNSSSPWFFLTAKYSIQKILFLIHISYSFVGQIHLFAVYVNKSVLIIWLFTLLEHFLKNLTLTLQLPQVSNHYSYTTFFFRIPFFFKT